MAFLNAVNRRRWDDKTIIADTGRLHLAAIASRKTDCHKSHVFSCGESDDEIGRIAARGESDKTVTCFALRNDLTREDMLESDVVADRRDHRDISDEIDRGERRTAGGDRMHEFDRDVRRITA